MPFAYLLRCRDGTLYAGAAVELARRLAEHAAGRASRYTRSRLPVALVWWRQVTTWSAALREEAAVKRLTRTQKEALVTAGSGAPDASGESSECGAREGAAGEGEAGKSRAAEAGAGEGKTGCSEGESDAGEGGEAEGGAAAAGPAAPVRGLPP